MSALPFPEKKDTDWISADQTGPAMPWQGWVCRSKRAKGREQLYVFAWNSSLLHARHWLLLPRTGQRERPSPEFIAVLTFWKAGPAVCGIPVLCLSFEERSPQPFRQSGMSRCRCGKENKVQEQEVVAPPETVQLKICGSQCLLHVAFGFRLASGLLSGRKRQPPPCRLGPEQETGIGVCQRFRCIVNAMNDTFGIR